MIASAMSMRFSAFRMTARPRPSSGRGAILAEDAYRSNADQPLRDQAAAKIGLDDAEQPLDEPWPSRPAPLEGAIHPQLASEPGVRPRRPEEMPAAPAGQFERRGLTSLMIRSS